MVQLEALSNRNYGEYGMHLFKILFIIALNGLKHSL